MKEKIVRRSLLSMSGTLRYTVYTAGWISHAIAIHANVVVFIIASASKIHVNFYHIVRQTCFKAIFGNARVK